MIAIATGTPYRQSSTNFQQFIATVMFKAAINPYDDIVGEAATVLADSQAHNLMAVYLNCPTFSKSDR